MPEDGNRESLRMFVVQNPDHHIPDGDKPSRLTVRNRYAKDHFQIEYNRVEIEYVGAQFSE
jgi:hypothetical protein